MRRLAPFIPPQSHPGVNFRQRNQAKARERPRPDELIKPGGFIFKKAMGRSSENCGKREQSKKPAKRAPDAGGTNCTEELPENTTFNRQKVISERYIQLVHLGFLARFSGARFLFPHLTAQMLFKTEPYLLEPFGRRSVSLQPFSPVDSRKRVAVGTARQTLNARFVRWCNGSTEPFGGFSHGSNPCRTATLLLCPKSFPRL